MDTTETTCSCTPDSHFSEAVGRTVTMHEATCGCFPRRGSDDGKAFWQTVHADSQKIGKGANR